jgi:hypothetical protein
MNPVSDEDLVLYHYRDGMPRERLAEIEDALFADDALRRRYERLRAELNAAGGAFAVAPPDAGFEARIWRGVRGALPREPVGARLSRWLAPREGGRLAFAFTVLAALALGWFLGRNGDAPAPVPVAQAPLLERDAGERVLAAYLARHFETTERALLIAANGDVDDATARELAQQLVASNRLYASAAQRANRPQLAHDEAGIAPAELRESIRARDLPFKARAAAALARQDLAPATTSL